MRGLISKHRIKRSEQWIPFGKGMPTEESVAFGAQCPCRLAERCAEACPRVRIPYRNKVPDALLCALRMTVGPEQQPHPYRVPGFLVCRLMGLGLCDLHVVPSSSPFPMDLSSHETEAAKKEGPAGVSGAQLLALWPRVSLSTRSSGEAECPRGTS